MDIRNQSNVKVVILAGGLGTRLAEKTGVKPKPMVEIGGRPILWHIMKHYSHYGFKEFFIALGYMGEVIKRYFLEYYALNGSMTINLLDGNVKEHKKECEDWNVHLIDTGLHANTGERVKRLEPWLKGETFMLTYGDGLCDLDLRHLLRFHSSHGKLATVTAVRPPARFGSLVFDGDFLAEFTEKPQIGEGWINGGFLILGPEIFEYLEEDTTSLEKGVLERLAADGQLTAYPHDSFWQCMDTMRDVRLLENFWQSEKVPWKVWD